MRTKLYYLAILLLFILTSCGTENVNKGKVIGNTGLFNLISYKINGHEYIKYGGNFTHSGECAKCKHELDSVVKNAVNEALEASLPENWNMY